MPRPRVIFVNRVYWPSEAATAQLLTDLAEALAGRGWPVEVVATGREEGTHHGVRIHRAGPTRGAGGMLARAFADWRFLREVRRRLGPLASPGDLVVPMTDPPMLSAAATTVACRRGARVVNWIQDIYPEIVPAHLGPVAALPLLPLAGLRNRAWRRAAANVIVGADMAPVLAAGGVAPAAVHHLPNWAPRELDEAPAAGAVAARRRDWQVADRFVVAYSGNLGRVHEFDTVLAAAARLRDEPGIVFLVVGDGPRHAAVRERAAQLGLPNLRFLPPQPRSELAVSLAAADVHLVTLRAGFERLVSPSKLAGVLAAARPVAFVGPPSCDLARAIAARDCGFVVAPGDDGALAAGLRALAADTARRARCSAHARAWHQAQFTLAGAVGNWEQVLRAAAGPEVRVASPAPGPQTLPPA